MSITSTGFHVFHARIENKTGHALKYITHDTAHGSIRSIPAEIEDGKTGRFEFFNDQNRGSQGFVVYEVQDAHKDRLRLYYEDRVNGNAQHYRVYPLNSNKERAFYGNTNRSVRWKTIDGHKTATFTIGKRHIPELFMAIADTHVYNDDLPVMEMNKGFVNAINTRVMKDQSKYLGAVICGDLYQNNWDNSGRPRDAYMELYCQYPSGNPNLQSCNGLKLPAYEGVGNHCEFRRQSRGSSWRMVEARNKSYEGRRWVDEVCRDTGYHYSWVWKGVRFYQLNLCPGNGSPRAKYSQTTQNSLRFLQRMLDKYPKTPTVICFHYGLSDDTHNNNFWGERERTEFGRVIEKEHKYIKAIITGHIHRTDILEYDWVFNGHTYKSFEVGSWIRNLRQAQAYVFKIDDNQNIILLRNETIRFSLPRSEADNGLVSAAALSDEDEVLEYSLPEDDNDFIGEEQEDE